MATFIYTSGTTGPPKAVVLSHENLSHTSDAAGEMIEVRTDDRLVSYLPLSHIAEQVFTIHGHLTAGYRVWYARSMETLLEEFQTVRPTIVFGVPRVWEKMHARLSDALSKATGVKAFLAGWAQQVGRQAAQVRCRGQEPTGWLGLQDRLARQRVQQPILARLGLDATRIAISGAAPIAKEVLEFFTGIGLVIHEVYGQSEGTGPTTFNRPGKTRLGTVGTAIPGAEVRTGEDGEILLRGKNVFQGYFKDPEATAATVEDGWLHSGDLGRLDEEGFLHITGRKKDILITAGGKNITPNNLEGALKQLPLVSQAVVVGDRRPYLVALLTLDPEAARAFATAHGLAVDSLHEHPDVRAELQRGIDASVNPELARVEQIKRFAVLPRELSIDAGELTPTLKVKRHVVERQWSTVVDGLYAA
jgi:long-chain acyl-CoA synthetase